MSQPTLFDWITLPLAFPLAYLNPISRTAIKAIRSTWANNNGDGLGRSTPQEIRELLTAEVMQQVSEVLLSPNKVMAVREKLANNVIMLAKYMVLILPPPTEPFESGVDWRKLPGISGELGGHLEELAVLDDEIKQLREKFEFKTSQELRDACVLHFRRFSFGVAVFDCIRIKIRDNHPDKTKDWLRPFIHAMCAWEEANYRQKLKLPDILEEQDDFGELAFLKYQTFLGFVTRGERYPNLAWQESYAPKVGAS